MENNLKSKRNGEDLPFHVPCLWPW